MLYLLILFVYIVYGTDNKVIANMVVNPTFEKHIFVIVNIIRSRGSICGNISMPSVPLLEWNDLLADVARKHSIDMAGSNYFKHGSLYDRVEAAGYTNIKAINQNIAAGYEDPSIMNVWPGDFKYCMSIMSPLYKEMGVGHTYNSLSKHKTYWTQILASK